MAVRIAKNRRGGAVDAVAITVARSARRVLTTGFTFTKTTGRWSITPVVTRPPGPKLCDRHHLA